MRFGRRVNMASKAQVKASNQYDKKNTTSVLVKLNKNTDKDIIDHLKNVTPSKMGYIKKLIRDDIKNLIEKEK